MGKKDADVLKEIVDKGQHISIYELLNEHLVEESDLDKELEELRNEIQRLVGKYEIDKIRNIVESSYQYDKKKTFKISHNVVE